MSPLCEAIKDQSVVVCFDPGVTTGVTVTQIESLNCRSFNVLWFDFWTIEQDTLHPEKDVESYQSILTATEPDYILIENVVWSGPLNTAKGRQIRSFDRTLYATQSHINNQVSKGKDCVLVFVQPEMRKRWLTIGLPSKLLTSHCRDAYRHIMAWWNMEGMYRTRK